MRTIQMTIDEPLLAQVDRAIRELHTTRSEFIREALKSAIRQHQIAELEDQHAAGYQQHPMSPDEITEWRSEQHWGEA